MMNRISFILLSLLLTSIVVIQLDDLLDIKTCGKNETYTTCDSTCPPTCDDIRYPLSKPYKTCILLCKFDCFCKNDYYRAEDGSCVSPEKCCDDNEKYKTCGSACIEICDNKPEQCTKQCAVGCFCAWSDHVRQNNSTDIVHVFIVIIVQMHVTKIVKNKMLLPMKDALNYVFLLKKTI